MQSKSSCKRKTTSDCEEEFNGVARDLLAKQHAAAHGLPPYPNVDEETKVQLAKQVSRASLLGAVVEQSSNTRVVPSADQLEAMLHLRWVQKYHLRRAQHNREEHLPEPISANEEQPLNDLQDSVTNTIQELETGHCMDEEAEERKPSNSGIKWFLVAMFIFGIVGIGGVIFGYSGSSGGRVETTEAFHYCCARNDTRPPDRFLQLRSVLSSAWGFSNRIDSVGSSQRAALCWLSVFDKFDLEVVEGNRYETVQRFAMAALYYHFVGASSVQLGRREGLSGSNWLNAVHVCEWDFVACDGPDDAVTELFLDSMYLNKPIPEEVALMTDLVYLKLTGSLLTGQIPTALSLLTQLQVLDLRSNELTGTIPSELGFLIALRALCFRHNKLVGEIPPEIIEIPHLHDLVLANNWLTGVLPSALTNSTGLTTISIEYNGLVGGIPDISRLTNLDYLGLGDNHIHGRFPDISRLTKLVSLELSDIDLSGTIPSTLWFFPNLEIINLESTFGVSGTLPAAIGLLTKLEILGVGGTMLAGTVPTTLGNLSNLRILSLSGLVSLTGTLPTALGRLTKLESLYLPGGESTLSGSIPDEVCDLRTDGSLHVIQPITQCG